MNEKCNLITEFQPTTPNNTDKTEYKIELAWMNVLAFIYLHGASIYACTISKYYSTYIVGKFLKLN